mgnify:CR=1 FL=1
MPKFSKTEKENIRNRLHKEGESLFVRHGIKKVTIEELAKSAGIASGSFYSFYDSKESLYLALNINAQNRIFDQLKKDLLPPGQSSSKENSKKALKKMIIHFMNTPILSMLDSDTWEQITRKVSPELLQEHLDQDTAIVDFFSQSGIKFRYPQKTTAKVFQAISMFVQDTVKISLEQEVFDIMLTGILNQILSD